MPVDETLKVQLLLLRATCQQLLGARDNLDPGVLNGVLPNNLHGLDEPEHHNHNTNTNGFFLFFFLSKIHIGLGFGCPTKKNYWK